MQLSFRPEAPAFPGISTSRYADPEADGVTPVLRSGKEVSPDFRALGGSHTHSANCIGLPGSGGFESARLRVAVILIEGRRCCARRAVDASSVRHQTQQRGD